MALPLASAGLRVAMATAKFAGKKLTKKGKQGYKLSRSLVKSKRVRTAYTKATVRKTGTALDYASKQASTIGKQTQRHLKFYKKVISPQGTQFKNLITRPTFGDYGGVVTTKGRKIRKNILKGGIYGGYIYGASKLRS